MKRICLGCVGMGLVSFFVVVNLKAATFTPMGTFASDIASITVRQISADGSTTVGGLKTESHIISRAFRWTKGLGYELLGDLPGGTERTHSYAASEDGSIVIGFGASANGGKEPFAWTAGSGIIGLGDLPPALYNNVMFGLSSDGQVGTGQSKISSTDKVVYRWTPLGGFVSLGDLPGGGVEGLPRAISSDGSTIVGKGDSNNGTEAFVWNAIDGFTPLGDLAGGAFESQAWGVSADGSVVVGESYSANGTQEAFRWTESGGMVGLGDLAGGDFYSRALDISADGQVIVGRGKTETDSEAFIWDPVNKMRRLQTVIEEEHGIDMTGWTLYQARGISDDGLIVTGTGKNPDGVAGPWQVDLVAAGDFNRDREIDDVDVDALSNAINAGGFETYFDLNGDEAVTFDDGLVLVEDVLNTLRGDFNLDGQVDVADLSIWATGFASGTRFSEGDSNFDGQVDVADLSNWATGFGYSRPVEAVGFFEVNGAVSAVVIPEPSGLVLGLVVLVGVGGRRGRRVIAHG